jgi:heat shock protein 4
MSKDDLFSCEVIGGGSRIPCVKDALKALLGREISTTLNAEEAVARGLALQGAMLSPAFKVRDFSINEVSLYPINIAWGSSDAKDEAAVDMETDAGDAAPGKLSAGGSELFSRLNSMPSTKMLTLYRSGTFALNASYPEGAQTPHGTQSQFADFTVGGLPLPKQAADAKTKVKVKVRLDENGILNVESAQAIEEKEVEVWEDAPKDETAAAAAPAAEGAPAADGEASAAAEPAKIKKLKKKTERHNLPVEVRRAPAAWPLARTASRGGRGKGQARHGQSEGARRAQQGVWHGARDARDDWHVSTLT